MKAIITVGIPASGKTEFAMNFCRKHKAVNTNRDDIRMSLFGCRTNRDYKFSNKNEDMVSSVQKSIIEHAARNGLDLIISDTNLNKERNRQMASFLRGIGYKDVQEEHFHVSLEEALKRDAQRENGVGREAIARMYNLYLEYHNAWKYTPDESLPSAYIFDVDGTLAKMKGRSAYDWERVGEDLPSHAVIEIARALKTAGHQILVVSGRDAVCRKQTTDWLVEHHVPFDALFMRPIGSRDKDTVIKGHILKNDIAPNYNILGVFDDRPSVVRMWNEVGVRVFAIGNQLLEF